MLTASGVRRCAVRRLQRGDRDYITVTEIAEIACDLLGLSPGPTSFEYTGGDRGWKGDVPVVRLDSSKIRSLGWANARTAREALRDSMASMADQARSGLMPA